MKERRLKRKKRKSRISIDDYVKALNTLKPYILIDHQIGDEDSEDYFELVSNQASQETLLIKKQLFERLSKEAKGIVGLILDTPDKIVESLCSPKSKKISRKRIERYLKYIYKRRRIVKSIIKELDEWVKTF